MIERKSKNYMFLYTALCIGFVLLSPEVVKLFSSEDFWSGMELIPIIAFSCYMVSRFLNVTVPFSRVSSSTVTANGVPTASALR